MGILRKTCDRCSKGHFFGSGPPPRCPFSPLCFLWEGSPTKLDFLKGYPPDLSLKALETLQQQRAREEQARGVFLAFPRRRDVPVRFVWVVLTGKPRTLNSPLSICRETKTSSPTCPLFSHVQNPHCPKTVVGGVEGHWSILGGP